MKKRLFFNLTAHFLFDFRAQILPHWCSGRVPWILRYPMFTVLSGIIVYLATRNTGWVLKEGGIAARLLNYVGDRSYSLYVCHPVIIMGIYGSIYNNTQLVPAWMKNSASGVTLQILFLYIISLLVSDLSYRFIEMPYINHGKNVIKSFREKSVLKQAGDKQKSVQHVNVQAERKLVEEI